MLEFQALSTAVSSVFLQLNLRVLNSLVLLDLFSEVKFMNVEFT